MSVFLEPHLTDPLAPPPSYEEVTNHEQQVASQSRIRAYNDNIIPSAPLVINVDRAQPQPTTRSYRAVIITGIIVGGLVVIALIASLTFIFVKHSTTIATTTTTTVITTTTTTKRPSNIYMKKFEFFVLKFTHIKLLII